LPGENNLDVSIRRWELHFDQLEANEAREHEELARENSELNKL